MSLRLIYAQTASENLAAADSALKAGDYAKAVQRAANAARQFEASGEREKLGVALNTAGAASVHRGDYPGALQWLDRSLRLARDAGDVASEVLRQNNIGGVHFFLGNYVEAFSRYQAALARLSGSQSEPWYVRSRQLTLTNLAILYLQLGQNQRALDLYREVRSLPLKVAPNIEAQMLTNLAIAYRRLGDPHQALEHYRQARRLLAKDPNAAAALYTLHNEGVVLALDYKDYPGALDRFTEALRIARRTGSRREVVLEQLFRGETFLLMKRPSDALAEYVEALDASEKLKLADERWTALYGMGRVHAATGNLTAALKYFQDSTAVIESARAGLGVASLKAEFLAGKRDVYDALIGLLLNQPNPPVAEILRRIEEARARNLKEQLPTEGRPVTLESVQRSLGERDMLLEYWTSGERLAVVWITHSDAGVISRELAKKDTDAIEALARSLSDRRSRDWKPLAKEAGSLLLDGRVPLDPSRIGRLVVVPDGSLHALPFEVLEVSGGGMLLERFDVSYLPSAHFLGRDMRATRTRWPWQVTLAAFADPLNETRGEASPFDSDWSRLTHSQPEARAAAGALPGRALLFFGADNRRSHLFEEALGRVPVLHFATHAAIDTVDSRRSRIVFSPVADDSGSRYLFWGDIAKLRLPGVELVTLAACESEQGRYVRGEGVESFSRAFLGAGAASSVGSLWRVSDQATAQFMALFYSHLASGATKAEALRRAKSVFRGATGEIAHPYYWAGFLLIGDGNSRLSRVVRWWQLIACASGVLLAGTFVVLRLRSRLRKQR